MTIFEKLIKVKGFVFDVDGVLTNGHVLVNENGEQWRTFHIRDGFALSYAIEQGYPVAAISGGQSEGVRTRLSYLGINEVYLGIQDKVSIMKTWVEKHQLTMQDILFMGDDLPDAGCLKVVGFPACPHDAAEEIKAICTLITSKKGGEGAVREMIEKTLRVQNKWGCELQTPNG